MRVELSPELFDSPTSTALLVTFFGYAIDDRHRVDVDLSHPSVRRWVDAQSPDLREEIESAVALSAKLEAREPALTVAVISRAPVSDFQSRPIRLRLDDARAFLEKPFELVLEDEMSDRNFLLKMMTSEEQHFLQRRLGDGFVRIRHGGGLPPMKRSMEELGGDPAARYKTWVLFDSDALQPGRPSQLSADLKRVCGPIPHHQLSRRFMESYLPLKALHTWATREPRRRQKNAFAMLRAFAGMSAPQRHHYNMKTGFRGDADRTDASAGTLYENVTAPDSLRLQNGFGPGIGALFDGPAVRESDLRGDSGWSELRPVVQQLLALLR